jgi:DNA polymerase-3 subunit epsilon
LVSLIVESQEIRRLWPKYNLAQKYKVEEWGIFSYDDQGGYRRFSVNMVTRGSKPLIKFSTKGDAWNFLWEKVHAYELCPKLSGLQLKKGLCFSYQTGGCKGACSGMEKAASYNKRAAKAVKSFHDTSASYAIVGRGRNANENSVVVVDKGKFAGYGFISKKTRIKSVRSVKRHVKNGVETSSVQNLVNSYLLNPRGAKVLVIG